MNHQNSKPKWSLLLLFWVSLATRLVLLLEATGLVEYSRERELSHALTMSKQGASMLWQVALQKAILRDENS